MMPRFREEETTELAFFFLKAAGGGVTKSRLMRLLYATEREAIIRYNWPITFDSYVSMESGPALWNAMLLMTNGGGFDGSFGKYWSGRIESDHDTCSVAWGAPDVDYGNLCIKDLELAGEIYTRYGDTECLTGTDLPEWQDPGNSTRPLPLQDLLKAVGFDSERIAEFMSQVHVDGLIDSYGIASKKTGGQIDPARPVDAALVERIQSLTNGVDVDLDAALSADDE